MQLSMLSLPANVATSAEANLSACQQLTLSPDLQPAVDMLHCLQVKAARLTAQSAALLSFGQPAWSQVLNPFMLCCAVKLPE